MSKRQKRAYELEIQWTQFFHPANAAEYGRHKFPSTRQDAHSIRRAINAALLRFFTDKPNRRARLDAHTALTVVAKRLPRKPKKDTRCPNRSTK
jgi:hypothetical protein